MADTLLTEEEVCAELRGKVTLRALRNWRYRCKGPPYIKIGRGVVYPRASLMAWLESLAQGSACLKSAANADGQNGPNVNTNTSPSLNATASGSNQPPREPPPSGKRGPSKKPLESTFDEQVRLAAERLYAKMGA